MFGVLGVLIDFDPFVLAFVPEEFPEQGGDINALRGGQFFERRNLGGREPVRHEFLVLGVLTRHGWAGVGGVA